MTGETPISKQTMILSGDRHSAAKLAEFEGLSKPLIKWLNDNCNPHHSIIIDCLSAELVSGEIAVHTEEFLKD